MRYGARRVALPSARSWLSCAVCLVGCAYDPIDVSERPPPCAEGYVVADGVCVRARDAGPRDAGFDAGVEDAGVADAGVADAFYRSVPESPVRIDGDVDAAHLGEESGVAEPCHGDFITRGFGQQAVMATGLAWGQERGDEHLVEELHVALPPAFSGEEADAITFGRCFKEGTAFALQRADKAGSTGGRRRVE